jgi:hypothetical protein
MPAYRAMLSLAGIIPRDTPHRNAAKVITIENPEGEGISQPNPALPILFLYYNLLKSYT